MILFQRVLLTLTILLTAPLTPHSSLAAAGVTPTQRVCHVCETVGPVSSPTPRLGLCGPHCSEFVEETALPTPSPSSTITPGSTVTPGKTITPGSAPTQSRPAAGNTPAYLALFAALLAAGIALRGFQRKKD